MPLYKQQKTPPKAVKAKEKSKKKHKQKQKKTLKQGQDLETAAYLTQTFFPIPFEPRGKKTQGTPNSQSDSKQFVPEPILVVRPTSDKKLSPMVETTNPVEGSLP